MGTTFVTVSLGYKRKDAIYRNNYLRCVGAYYDNKEICLAV